MTAETFEGSLDVVVEDDGIGGADARNGSGLIGLKDRVEALGGHLEIRSEPGHGTCLHADIPLGRRHRAADGCPLRKPGSGARQTSQGGVRTRTTESGATVPLIWPSLCRQPPRIRANNGELSRMPVCRFPVIRQLPAAVLSTATASGSTRPDW
jgi:hypothetical protein